MYHTLVFYGSKYWWPTNNLENAYLLLILTIYTIPHTGVLWVEIMMTHKEPWYPTKQVRFSWNDLHDCMKDFCKGKLYQHVLKTLIYLEAMFLLKVVYFNCLYLLIFVRATKKNLVFLIGKQFYGYVMS